MLFLVGLSNHWLRITNTLWLTLFLVTLVNTDHSMVACSLSPGDLIASTSVNTFGFNKTIDFNRKQAHLTRSGFTQIMYNYVDSNVNQLHHHQVSFKCIQILINLNRSLENGNQWAFESKFNLNFLLIIITQLELN